MPKLTCALDTTHTEIMDKIRTKKTEIFIKAIHDKEMKRPTTDSPPALPFTHSIHVVSSTNNATETLTSN